MKLKESVGRATESKNTLQFFEGIVRSWSSGKWVVVFFFFLSISKWGGLFLRRNDSNHGTNATEK